ncbi:hypothetical protein G7046_g5589 [Stylonectria norvegica]|nr:hypothetical protein G7046_g5589 [Stylonectria norvegica]
MASERSVGHFQTLEFPSPNKAIIRDQIYGSHTISEPILVDLLRSPAMQRLTGVGQHGITGLLGMTPTRVTRFEHSVGAFILVRKVGATVEEQVAALLHDVSHTALSHVVDWALSKPGEDSFHEVHKARYIKTTTLPETLAEHGLGDLKVLQEELYPLVEMPSPHLCADRLDYALRDIVGFGKLPIDEMRHLFIALEAHPNPSDPRRLLVLPNQQLGLALARAYLSVDRDVWSNPAHIDLYRRAGQLIGDAVRSGSLDEEQLWIHGRFMMKQMESEGLPRERGLGLPQGTKIRTIDPDILLSTFSEPTPLSKVYPEWDTERQSYIEARRALYN